VQGAIRAAKRNYWQRWAQLPLTEQALILCMLAQAALLAVTSGGCFAEPCWEAAGRHDCETREEQRHRHYLAIVLLLLALLLSVLARRALAKENSGQLVLTALLSLLLLATSAADFTLQAVAHRAPLCGGLLPRAVRLALQVAVTLLLLLTSWVAHRDFGWRSFEQVSSRQITRPAHSALLGVRTLAEWEALLRSAFLVWAWRAP
jgi:hypothetical protein